MRQMRNSHMLLLRFAHRRHEEHNGRTSARQREIALNVARVTRPATLLTPVTRPGNGAVAGTRIGRGFALHTIDRHCHQGATQPLPVVKTKSQVTGDVAACFPATTVVFRVVIKR